MKYSWMILCLIFCGCENEYEKQRLRDKDATTVRSTYYLKTVVHDEHLFVLSTYGCFLHHPDCPCFKIKTPEKINEIPPPIIIDLSQGFKK